MSMTLSRCSIPSIASWAPGSVSGAVQVTRERGLKDIAHQRAFTRARDARHTDEQTQREIDVDFLQVVMARGFHSQEPIAGHFAVSLGIAIALVPAR